MKTVRFVRDTDPQREGGPGFKSGEVHSLVPRIAQRWVIRGAAVYEADAKPARAGVEREAAAKAFKKESTSVASEQANADTVVSPAESVEGEDGDSAGERPEPDASTAGGKAGGSGRSSGSGSGKQHWRSNSKK